MIVTDRPRILIGDDHLLVAEAVKNLLIEEFNVVGVVADGRALVEAALELEPDVVLADIAMPKLNGLDAAQRIKHLLPSTKVVFLTMLDDPEVADEALRRGGSAVLLKTSAFSELVRAIHTALNRPLEIVPPQGPRVQVNVGEAVAALTDRQREVLQLLAEGLSLKEVASVLKITKRTAAFHKYRIMHTFRVQSDAELVQLAICKHLLFVAAPVEMHSGTEEIDVAGRRGTRSHYPNRAAKAA